MYQYSKTNTIFDHYLYPSQIHKQFNQYIKKNNNEEYNSRSKQRDSNGAELKVNKANKVNKVK